MQEHSIPEGDEEHSRPGSEHTESPSVDDTDVDTPAEPNDNGYHTPSVDHRSLEKEEQRLALALEECLGLAADDPDIAEAKDRLLKSNFLSPDIFAAPDSSDDDDAIDRQIGAYLGENIDVIDEEDESESVAGGELDEEVGASDYYPQGGVYSNVKYIEDEEAARETTNLLSTPDYKLRPSIFTTVASIAEPESDSDRKDVEQGSTPS